MIQIVSRVKYDVLKAVADQMPFGLHTYALHPRYLPLSLKWYIQKKLVHEGLLIAEGDFTWTTISPEGLEQVKLYEQATV